MLLAQVSPFAVGSAMDMLSFAKVSCVVNCELRSSQKICEKRNGYQYANHPQSRAIADLIGAQYEKSCAIRS